MFAVSECFYSFHSCIPSTQAGTGWGWREPLQESHDGIFAGLRPCNTGTSRGWSLRSRETRVFGIDHVQEPEELIGQTSDVRRHRLMLHTLGAGT